MIFMRLQKELDYPGDVSTPLEETKWSRFARQLDNKNPKGGRTQRVEMNK